MVCARNWPGAEVTAFPHALRRAQGVPPAATPRSARSPSLSFPRSRVGMPPGRSRGHSTERRRPLSPTPRATSARSPQSSPHQPPEVRQELDPGHPSIGISHLAPFTSHDRQADRLRCVRLASGHLEETRAVPYATEARQAQDGSGRPRRQPLMTRNPPDARKRARRGARNRSDIKRHPRGSPRPSGVLSFNAKT